MTFVQKNKFLTPTQALQRVKKYCAYQERSHQEVRYKLIELGLRGNYLENLMTRLIEEGFLNEERFAIAFAGGKFRMKNWGRNKIELELKRRGISDYCIGKAMKEIDESLYRKTLRSILKKKARSLKENGLTAKYKLAQFLIGKGFEPELVWEEVKGYYEE